MVPSSRDGGGIRLLTRSRWGWDATVKKVESGVCSIQFLDDQESFNSSQYLVRRYSVRVFIFCLKTLLLRLNHGGAPAFSGNSS